MLIDQKALNAAFLGVQPGCCALVEVYESRMSVIRILDKLQFVLGLHDIAIWLSAHDTVFSVSWQLSSFTVNQATLSHRNTVSS